MDVAFEGAHMIWDGVLCCTADDPEAYYAADARRVLELFVLAAEQGLELEADTLLAAAGAAPGVRSLSGRAAGAAGTAAFALRRTRGTGRFVRRRGVCIFRAAAARALSAWPGGGARRAYGAVVAVSAAVRDIRRAGRIAVRRAGTGRRSAGADGCSGCACCPQNTARGPAGAEACAEPPAGGAGL